MTDHDAIAATIRAYLATGGDGLLPDLPGAYLDLYDEVQRLRAFMRMIVDDRDRTFVLLAERAEEAEAERDEWQEEVARCTLSCPPGFRKSPASDGVKALRAERDRLRAALNEIATAASGIAHDLQIGPDDEGRDIHEMALAIRDDARAALKGDSDE